MKQNINLALALAILLGLVLNGIFIGRSLQRFKKEDRYISVKGFSEREVRATLAVWTIKTRITTNNIIEGSNEITSSKNKIIQFLIKNNFKKEEIIQKDLNVTDKQARDYGEQNMGNFRYIIENTIQVRSENVEKIQDVSRMTDELLKAGVVVSSTQDYNPAVKYLYTKLNEIKPEMLAEATKNARSAATEFTKDSGVKLGALRKASQGLFSITDRDDYLSGQMECGYGQNVNDIVKKVKVVISVDYSVE